MRLVALALVVALGGCISDELVECGDGRLCPAGWTCLPMSCATPEQVAACAGLTDGSTCALTVQGPGVCDLGACIVANCGNAFVEVGEQCDDGNVAGGDGCNATCTSLEVCANGVVDRDAGEDCDDSNTTNRDGCGVTCRAEQATWRFDSYGNRPGARSAHVMVYDAGRKRGLLFGGIGGGEQRLDDTWELVGNSWRALGGVPPLASPPERFDAAAAYDARRGRTVLFGGIRGSVPRDDTWEFDGVTWRQIPPASSPPARAEHVMAYDSIRDRIVMFGGASTMGTLLGDTWEYDGTSWTLLNTAQAPSPRSNSTMTFDPIRGDLVLVGGWTDVGMTNEVWTLAGSTWTLQTPVAPLPPVAGHAMAFDPVRNRLVLRGGTADERVTTFEYDRVTWTELTTNTQPTARNSATMYYDIDRRRVVMFGGALGLSATYREVWLYGGQDWSLQAGPGLPNLNPEEITGTYDDARGRFVVVGLGPGVPNTAPLLCWEFDGAEWSPSTDPPGLSQIVYDAGRKRILQLSNGTWEYDGVQWTLATSQQPTPAYGDRMVYDRGRQRIVRFGGRSGSNDLAETWEFDGTAWELRTPTTSPPARKYHGMTYDEDRQRVVLFGGTGAELLGDTWEWDGMTWTAINVVGPEPRGHPMLVYHRARHRTILAAGAGDGGIDLRDTWEYDGTRWDEVSTTFYSANGPAYAYGYSPDRGVIDHYFGLSFAYAPEAAIEACTSGIDYDGDGSVGCADDECVDMCKFCGDGTCDRVENARSCASDCATTPQCGDYFCDSPESVASCPGDC